MRGKCPLTDPIRIQRFGKVTLNSSFLASCPMAVSSTMFVSQLVKSSANNGMSSPLAHIDHLGSYACRNIYHRAKGRLSEHATADAWDIAAFRLKNNDRISVLNHWVQPEEKARWLHQAFQQSCYFLVTRWGLTTMPRTPIISTLACGDLACAAKYIALLHPVLAAKG